MLSANACSKDDKTQIIHPRTVLIYISADNSLSKFACSNMDNIMKGVADDNLNNGNLLIYIDPADDAPQLVQIKKGYSGSVEQHVVCTYPEQNSASGEVMRNVLDEVFSSGQYTAESYGLVLWSHGTAWLPSDIDVYVRFFGEDTGNYMEINELKETLANYHFDFIIFDACYMASIEVAFDLRNNASYILASPTEILGDGLPYHQIIKYLFSNDSLQQELINTGQAFYSFYEKQQGGHQLPRSASVSLVKTETLPQLARICHQIAAGKENEIFNIPLSEVQVLDFLSYNHHFLYDFSDYINHLASDEQYLQFQEILNNIVIYKETTDIGYFGIGKTLPIDRKRFCGLSTYIPQKQLYALNEWYKRLDWYKAIEE
jgi:hypothetical protein